MLKNRILGLVHGKGRVWSGSANGKVLAWDCATGECMAEMETLESQNTDLSAGDNHFLFWMDNKLNQQSYVGFSILVKLLVCFTFDHHLLMVRVTPVDRPLHRRGKLSGTDRRCSVGWNDIWCDPRLGYWLV